MGGKAEDFAFFCNRAEKMKVFIVGGTGLLGCEAAKQLIKKGHEVKSIALPPLPEGAEIPEEMKIVFGDVLKKSEEELEELLKGVDVLVFAAGVDERVEFPAPVLEYYKKYNILPLEKLFPVCKKAGVKRAVILGSYFSYLKKKFPEGNFAQKNKYIKSRMLQEEFCKAHADMNFSVCVLELPYIFGTQPGRKPVWTILIEQIAFMDKMPFTMYPKGGTAMLTCRQVGQVISGAVEREKEGFEAIPIGMYNLNWKEFLSVVYDARGMGADRKIVGVSPWMMKMGMIKAVKDYKKRKIDSGIDPFNLPYIMDINLFIDKRFSVELGATEDDINAAIKDSIIVSEKAFKNEVKLLDMKAE